MSVAEAVMVIAVTATCGEAVVLDVGREGFLHFGFVDLDLGFETSGGEGGDVDGPLGAFAIEDALDLAGGGVTGAGEGADRFLNAPGVLDVGLEAGARLVVGHVELLGGELQELVEAIRVLAVGEVVISRATRRISTTEGAGMPRESARLSSATRWTRPFSFMRCPVIWAKKVASRKRARTVGSLRSTPWYM